MAKAGIRIVALASLGVIALGLASPAPATPLDPVAPADARKPGAAQQDILAALGTPLADDELGEMRGKFISPDAVSYFGISLVTSWQDEAGVTTIANLAFNVDFLPGMSGAGSVPRLMVGWVRENGDPAMDVTGVPTGYVAVSPDPSQMVAVGALDTLTGAGQVNVVAGADNSTRNTMHIAVVPRNAVPQLPAAGLQPISGSTAVQFEDGDGVQFRLANNQIGLALTSGNGLDSSFQSLGGNFSQFIQQITIQSNGNDVLNSASIVLGIDPLQSFDRIRTEGARLSMKGFGF